MKLNRDTQTWEKIVKSSPEVICKIDREGHFVSINEGCESILGYECRELVGRHVQQFVCQKNLAHTLQSLVDSCQGGGPRSFESGCFHKNGQEVNVLWSVAWSEEEQVIFAVARDVTSQKYAKKKDELYKALVEHGADILTLLDKDLNFLKNKVTNLKQLGYTPEQLAGANALDYVHPQDVPLLMEALSKVLASGGAATVSDYRFKDAGGSWRWLETTLSNQLLNPSVKALVASSRDVTERIMNRQKLQESEQRFKSLFEHHLDIVLFQDREGVIIDANAATLAFFGVKKQDILNRPFADFLLPETVKVCEQTLQMALNGESVRFEIDIPFEGKGIYVFDVLKVPVKVREETIGVYSVLRDVTAIHHSHHIIKRQAEKLNTIFESITDAFFTIDKEWRFTYINNEFERLLHVQRELLIAKSVWTAFPEEVKEELHQQFDYAVEKDKAIHFELYLEGLHKWLQVKAFPSDEGLSVYLEDITEKVQSKQELEKLSLVASKTTNGVLIMNAEGITEWVNSGFTNITGYSFAEVVGRKPSELLHGPETDKDIVKKIWGKISMGQAFKDEILSYKKSGEKVWILLDMSPVLDEKGALAKIIIIQKDITSRKEGEARQLALTEDLYKKNQDLQQFTYIVSHNLRSPVANALGLAEMLQASGPDSVDFNTTLHYLKTSIDQLDTVLKDLNMILSLRDKKDAVEKERIPLTQVFQQVLADLQDQLEECGGKIQLELDESVRLRGNKAYLFSIFHNLLSNAIKYRSENRPLEVSVKCLASSANGSLISFSDNGSGFDMDLAGDKLFKLYSRFHVGSEGKGIGLYLVKAHLEALEGHIEVSSQVDVGTGFNIFLK